MTAVFHTPATFLAMANRVRRRNRRVLQSSEDVMANEPDFAYSDAGPHAPMIFHPVEKSDDEDTLIHKDIVSSAAILLH
ncbi:unnamed protein product [Nippostrongylus brasiliensis]|uniref:Uncharacterized protein n=1 Tax=Nippostrongylus brasiliensis TaxID=27835 RepID=A0A0N4YDG3_NIPBR|nr:unnamed protein product [Nippostrongylus brasiliensis]